jgi:3-isopropylmalate dehydrogenase
MAQETRAQAPSGSDSPSPVPRWLESVCDGPAPQAAPGRPRVVGVLEGEGVGREVTGAALRVLDAVGAVSPEKFTVRVGGLIGLEALERHGQVLTEEVEVFCRRVAADGGAILAGPGGGRFVYDLRKRFDLFCKLSPIQVYDELCEAGRLKNRHARNVDILVVRENVGGIYQGDWTETSSADRGRVARHHFSYAQDEVRRILDVAAGIAATRRGNVAVIWKKDGLPTVSKLWSDCASEAAREFGVSHSMVDIDYAAYRMIQDAPELDVVVAPNLFGDVLCDLGAVLIGSRAVSYSGNFNTEGLGVYQTNHGAAYDLAGSDRANPVGQILSLAMMLRESFGLDRESRLVEDAVRAVWRQGWQTADLAEDGPRIVGTRRMAELIADAVTALAPSLKVG